MTNKMLNKTRNIKSEILKVQKLKNRKKGGKQYKKKPRKQKLKNPKKPVLRKPTKKSEKN